ncbi:MAG: M48 family metallopeptidase [Bacteroidales bacterium]|nr:M48 family metallopeptidase [Bacteroidales bacterium]
MKNKITGFFLLSLMALAVTSNAQQVYNLDRFDGIKSEGPVPTDLRLSLEELYSLDKQRVRDYNDGRLRNRDKVLAASFQINRMMSSGRILYGDPISRMVERIADTLLKDYPTLRKELRFYTLKSPDVNAFATGQGMVFVCTGLVAQVEDEAQLAFIISHEIVHYLRKHSLEEISRRKRDSDDIEAETQEMRDFIKYHNRSREMESEADSLGLQMFYLPSPYAKDVTEGVFDVLQYGYLPFDELVFDTAYFNTPYYQMPSDYFMKEVDPITARDDYNDSLSTHPNILKRRKATAAIVGNAKGGSRFVMVTQSEFEEIRTLARFECVRQDIIYAEYVRGFYDCYLLKKQYPDNRYVDKAMCQALYGLSKYKTNTSTSGVVGDYKEFEGEVQQCYYFFRRIKKDDLALITARKLWQSHCKYPDDKQIADMASDIFADLNVKYNWKTDFFSTQPPAEEVKDTATEGLSKYERLKRKKNQQRSADLHSYAFTDLLMKDKSFATYLNDHLKPAEVKTSDAVSSHKNQLVYCPTYYVVDRQNGELNIMKSNRNEKALYADISRAAAKNGIGSIDFSDQSLKNITTADRYNEWVDLNEWVGEFWQTKGDFEMHFSVQPQMDRVVEKYDAGTINMSIVLNLEQVSSNFSANELFFVMVPFLAPLVINDMVNHTEATAVYSIQIDAVNGRKLSKQTKSFDVVDEKALVRNALYDHYYHVEQDTCTKAIGYMGQKISVGLHGALKPNLHKGDVFSFPRSSIVAVDFGADVEFALWRRASLLLSATFTPMMYTTPYDGVGTNSYDLNRFNFSLGWRHYRHLAPLGYYWGLAADVSKYVLPNGENVTLDNDLCFGFHAEFGRKHIFYDHLTFGYFVQYGLMTSSPCDDDDIAQSFVANFLMAFRLGVTLGFQP